jgi:hypothetical protein
METGRGVLLQFLCLELVIGIGKLWDERIAA